MRCVFHWQFSHSDTWPHQVPQSSGWCHCDIGMLPFPMGHKCSIMLLIKCYYRDNVRDDVTPITENILIEKHDIGMLSPILAPNTQNAAIFHWISTTTLNDVIFWTKVSQLTKLCRKTCLNLVIRIMPAGGLAPLGAKASTGIMMAKSASCT